MRWAQRSVDSRFNILLFAIWMPISLLLGALALYIHPAFLALVLALMIAVNVGIYRIRCPRCGYSVMFRRPHQRMAWVLMRTYPPARCPQCGLSASARE